MTTKLRSAAVLAPMLVMTGMVAAGCGASPTAAGDRNPESTSGVPTTAAGAAGGVGAAPTTPPRSPAPPAPGSPSTTGPRPSPGGAPSRPDRCTSAGLDLRVTGIDAAMSTQVSAIVLTNTGDRPCTLAGYPGVSLADAEGRSLGEARRLDGVGPRVTVTLAPGGKASAELRTTTENAHDPCGRPLRTATAIRVIPPDDTGTLTAPFTHDRCPELTVPFVVGTVQPGEPTGAGLGPTD